MAINDWKSGSLPRPPRLWQNATLAKGITARQIDSTCTTCKARKTCEKRIRQVQFTTRETGSGLLSSQFDILSKKTEFNVSSYWMGGPVTYVSRARLPAEWDSQSYIWRCASIAAQQGQHICSISGITSIHSMVHMAFFGAFNSRF